MLFWVDLHDDLARFANETQGNYEQIYPQQGNQDLCYSPSAFQFGEYALGGRLDGMQEVECDSQSPLSARYQESLSYPLPCGGYSQESLWS